MPKVRQKHRRTHRISFCPDCGKRFANETRVLQHMNQPSSACSSWMDNLLRFHRHTSAAGNHANIHSSDRHQPASHSETALDADNAFAQEEFWPNDSTETASFNEDRDHIAPAVDTHPNVPSMHPGGKTFMDQFFSDEYSRFRQENLYYPFASESDWQLASWLLRSHLSMAAIDTFLSLELVRFSVFYFHFQANSKPRSRNFPSPFDRQKNYGFMQRCYLQVPGGSPMFSIPMFQPNTKLSCTIVIPSTVFNHC